MKTSWLASLLVFTFTQLAVSAPPVEPTPAKYFSGPVSRDVAAALKRGAAEHKPVWIVAWDDVFFRSPEGKSGLSSDYYLHYFYDNPETKKMVAGNFITAFTTMRNPAISQWIDPADKTHTPIYIVIDREGKMLVRKTHGGNPDAALKEVQEVVAQLK
ncbi:MAG: hypothetical protein ABJF10_21325 [Chthoniobacter sp.]|uniref:hypothetical protein n=1 Tax=Chthoniobacter sp. TaxID=2510640 RepID=UPI0032A9053F